MQQEVTLSLRSFFNKVIPWPPYVQSMLAGGLLPFGFAPFHLPMLAILGLALLFYQIQTQSPRKAALSGFSFGVGYLGFGVSWVFVSIHLYGHVNSVFSAMITGLFIAYLACFPALVGYFYAKLAPKQALWYRCVLFSALWCGGEWLRSTVFTGFPWLLIGFGQMDAPLHYLLPIIGIYGVGFLTCLLASLLAYSIQTPRYKYYCIFSVLLVFWSPSLLKPLTWSKLDDKPMSVGIIQANLSMRDKWDSNLFWKLMRYYDRNVNQLLKTQQLIVLPESAIPIPKNYIPEYLESIDQRAKKIGSAVLMGIPQSSRQEGQFYNTMLSLGSAKGRYLKEHPVPFGEFIPKPLQRVMDWLSLPGNNILAGNNKQLIEINQHPIASLICYELAYPELLRKQLPKAEWIVSISDDGWFGKSFAIFQHLQMAQVLSLQMGRYQIVANNDGLSSIINERGEITDSLPPFVAGNLQGTIYPATGASPWVRWGGYTCFVVLCFDYCVIDSKEEGRVCLLLNI